MPSGHPNVPSLLPMGCSGDGCATWEHRAPLAPQPHGTALPQLSEQLAPREHPEGPDGTEQGQAGPHHPSQHAVLPDLASPATARSSSSLRLLQPSAIDTDYKQRLLRVNTAAGSSAQPLLPEMPLLKHKDHSS